jgi:hypothetical protein
MLINLEELYLRDNKITKITKLGKIPEFTKLSIHSMTGLIEILDQYKKYVKKVKTPFELEWRDYFMIIAIINERYINIYRMYDYFELNNIPYICLFKKLIIFYK